MGREWRDHNLQPLPFRPRRRELDRLVTREQFEFIKSKYGLHASWAVWADEGDTPKSNMGDLRVLDPEINKDLLSELNPNVVLVGLNISRGAIHEPFGNFHDKRPAATDFKTRFAVKNSPLWGAYMTDIIKDFDQKISGKVIKYLKKNPSFEQENVNTFYQELSDIGSVAPTMIAFGNITYDILQRNFKNKFQILKIPHYASYVSKETYREEVRSVWKSLELATGPSMASSP